MKIKLLITAAAILAAIMIIVGTYMPRNKAIRLEEHIDSAQSDINVQEKRRADLIPNLVDCVKDYNQHEYETIMAVVEKRGTGTDEAVDEIKTMIAAVAEAYPELKADGNYQNLMLEMATTENLIAGSRENYNQWVRAYNQHIRSFPATLFLNITGYRAKTYEYLQYDDVTENTTRWLD